MEEFHGDEEEAVATESFERNRASLHTVPEFVTSDTTSPATEDAKQDTTHSTDSAGKADTNKVKATRFHFKSEKRRSEKRKAREGYDEDSRHRHSHKSHRRSRDGSPRRREHGHKHRSSRSKIHSTNDTGVGEGNSGGEQPVHPEPRLKDDNYDQPVPELDEEAAFRQALFDALADDEGAEYWAHAYGQPMHTYSRAATSEDGTLEEMDEEAYVAYVRRQMWERSSEGREEARRKRAAERKAEERRQEQEDAKARTRGQRSAFNSKARARAKQGYATQDQSDDTRYVFDFDELMDGALKRGAERKEARRWRDVWARYTSSWNNVSSSSSTSATTSNPTSSKNESTSKPNSNDISNGNTSKPNSNSSTANAEGTTNSNTTTNETKPIIENNTPQTQISYPVYSLRASDVSKQAITDFYTNISDFALSHSSSLADQYANTYNDDHHDYSNQSRKEKLKQILKVERVKWHPDKMQQRFGGSLDEKTMKKVTAVFQVVDELFTAQR